MILKITETNTPSMRSGKKINITRDSMITYIKSPFHNCQMSTIGGCNNLLNSNVNMSDVIETLKSLMGRRTLLLVDINQCNIDKVKKAFKPYVHKFNTNKYISTNGSPMALLLIYLK